MRQLLNATYAASVEWLDEDERAEFDRDLAVGPAVDPETGAVDRSRNVDLLLAAMGGGPPQQGRGEG